MEMLDLIRTRKSIRTFDGRPLRQSDIDALKAYAESIRDPWGIPVSFVFLDAEEYGLSSRVIEGEHLYVAGKVKYVPHCEEAFGYCFEKLVLYAWSLGIGTTWIGGTMERELFEKAADTKEDEIMMIVSPLGYPSEVKSEIDVTWRKAFHGDERRPYSELFFEHDFNTPLRKQENALEAVRLAPSAANMQPWTVIKDGNDYHFYKKQTKGYTPKVSWDVQKIDLGIAVCHFMSMKDCEFSLQDPGIPKEDDTVYIATLTAKE